MSDIDADLLALAGDDSDEDDQPQQTQAPAAESIGEPEASDDEVAMEESDDEGPGDDDSKHEQSATYPVEGRFKDDADRSRIMGLPEIEREQILAERAEEVLLEEQRRKLTAMWSSLGNDNDKKRKADADPNDGRKSARQKTVVTTARSDQLAELTRKRAEKQNKQPGTSRRERRTESPDANADGESEGEWEDRRGRRDQTPEEQPPTKRDFDRIKIGRHQFAMVCFNPGFEDSVKGCYVRVSVGPDPKNPGAIMYRMAKIEDIIEKAPYALANSQGKMMITTQHVVASIGKGKRESPFIHCSASPFEPAEVDFYLKRLQQDGLPAPKKIRLEAKTADINALINVRLTSEQITTRLERSSVLQRNFKERERERLERQKAEADEVGETDKAQRIQEQIDNIERNSVKLAYGTSMGTTKANETKTEMKTQQQRLAELNRQNRKADQERVRKALLAENRAKEKRKAANRETADKKDATVLAEMNGNLVHNIFSSKDDLELPYPEWTFNYVDYSNKYLGSRAMRHLAYDDKGRAVCEWPREMCDDEIIARMDIPLGCIVPEYD